MLNYYSHAGITNMLHVSATAITQISSSQFSQLTHLLYTIQSCQHWPWFSQSGLDVKIMVFVTHTFTISTYHSIMLVLARITRLLARITRLLVRITRPYHINNIVFSFPNVWEDQCDQRDVALKTPFALRTYVHTYMHTYIHGYIHTYTFRINL